jgi:nitroreductase
MEFNKLIDVRKSSRDFVAGKVIDSAVLDDIVAKAIKAPSACNAQTSHFVIIDKPSLVKEATALIRVSGSNPFLEGASAYILVIEDIQSLLSIIKHKDTSESLSRYNTGITVGFLSLAASDLGIGNCIIGQWQNQELLKLLGLSADTVIGGILALGYGKDEGISAKNRKSFDSLVKHA